MNINKKNIGWLFSNFTYKSIDVRKWAYQWLRDEKLEILLPASENFRIKILLFFRREQCLANKNLAFLHQINIFITVTKITMVLYFPSLLEIPIVTILHNQKKLSNSQCDSDQHVFAF